MMPEITDTPPAEVRAEHAALQAALTASLPPKHIDNNLLIASWNIRGFGDLTKKWTATAGDSRITSYNVCYTKLLRIGAGTIL